MCRKLFEFKIKDVNIEIQFSEQIMSLIHDRNLKFYTICGSIISIGEHILKMKDKEEFIIVDREESSTIVCQLNILNDSTIKIHIITIITNIENLFIKSGLRLNRFIDENVIY